MADGKRIVFSTFGSLGDLHPYIAVSRELARRGHRPLIATFDEYRDNVESSGIAFEPLRPAMEGFGDKAALMERLIHPWRGPELMIRGMFLPHLRETYEDLARACRGADLLVTHPLTLAGPLLAEKEGLRWASSALSPMTLFSAADPSLFPAAPWMLEIRRLGITPYRWLFAVPRVILRRWEQPLRKFRAELGLPPSNAIAALEGQFSPRLHLALFSDVLAAPQPDWPASTVVCGFPRYDGSALASALRAELEDFLAAGDPPIVYGLGSSAVMVAGHFWREAIATAQALGRRAILLTGKSTAELGPVPPSVKAFEYLPYSEVFPHACAVIHSGGIGTLAQALAAGRPQLMVPVAFDQPDNARRAAALGVARRVPFRKADAPTMTRELRQLLDASGFAARAREIGARVAREDGAQAAAAALEKVSQ